MSNRGRSIFEAELMRQELRQLHAQNLQDSTFEERVDLVSRLGIRILPSENLKSERIYCWLNLVKENEERGQAGFAKMTFGGEGGTRTPMP